MTFEADLIDLTLQFPAEVRLRGIRVIDGKLHLDLHRECLDPQNEGQLPAMPPIITYRGTEYRLRSGSIWGSLYVSTEDVRARRAYPVYIPIAVAQ